MAQSGEDVVRDTMNRGVAAFKQSHYTEAVAEFEKAASLDPENLNVRLYLGAAYRAMWMPKSQAQDNEEYFRRSEVAYRFVLERDAYNKGALGGLASLEFGLAKSIMPERAQLQERSARLDQSEALYRKLSEVAPNDKTAFYSLGVIGWERFYPALIAARARLVMRPEDPGPITDVNTRAQLRTQYGAIVEAAMANLNRAISIDPDYDDAMAYLSLLYRERADYRDSAAEWRSDMQEADALVARAREAKRHKAESGAEVPVITSERNPVGGNAQSAGTSSDRIRVGGNIQAANLIYKLIPVYPPLALQARIQGTVRFSIIVGKDGVIQNVQLVSGHPLLVPAATEALKQWKYKPTLLNGQPVEVITQADVNFTLSQ